LNIWIDIFGWTGTYIFTDGNTFYIGKGPVQRMNASINYRIGGMSNVIKGSHFDFRNDKMGFMVEHLMMKEYNARYSPDFANSTRIDSPGKRFYENASAIEKAQADANFNRMKKEWEGKTKGIHYH
jgi:hypothetical protein